MGTVPIHFYLQHLKLYCLFLGNAQGSILGPLLYLVYINDFPLAVKCNCGLFADESILHRKVTSKPDCEDLQTDLDN